MANNILASIGGVSFEINVGFKVNVGFRASVGFRVNYSSISGVDFRVDYL